MPHNVEGLVVWLLVGLVAGWLASLVMKTGGLTVIGYLLVGVVGAVIGGVLFDLLDIGFHGVLGRIVAAFLGSLILLAVAKAVRK
ncbi:MAG: GlsB/YeaQ/YmgE family stress response membrane protein [Alphaproteobacteria bacterium]|nr:GlsB/YeaQ/YmgE family stress response membrane protein [Alphaproteobacteria bacterium]